MESQKGNIFRISGLSSLPASPQEQRYKSPQSPADQTPSHSLCGAGPAATPGAALLPTAWFPVEPEWGAGQVGTRPASSLWGLGRGRNPGQAAIRLPVKPQICPAWCSMGHCDKCSAAENAINVDFFPPAHSPPAAQALHSDCF